MKPMTNQGNGSGAVPVVVDETLAVLRRPQAISASSVGSSISTLLSFISFAVFSAFGHCERGAVHLREFEDAGAYEDAVAPSSDAGIHPAPSGNGKTSSASVPASVINAIDRPVFCSRARVSALTHRTAAAPQMVLPAAIGRASSALVAMNEIARPIWPSIANSVRRAAQ